MPPDQAEVILVPFTEASVCPVVATMRVEPIQVGVGAEAHVAE